MWLVEEPAPKDTTTLDNPSNPSNPSNPELPKGIDENHTHPYGILKYHQCKQKEVSTNKDETEDLALLCFALLCFALQRTKKKKKKKRRGKGMKYNKNNNLKLCQ